MSVPRVSVVMPAYNADRYIGQAVESVLGQAEPDLELVVVDDGSADQTAAVVRDAAAVDPRVRLVQQPNSGKPAIARNRGIRESRGEIISFLDADDLWHPEKLRCGLRFLDEQPGIDLVFHDVEFMDERGSLSGRRCLGSTDFAHQVLTSSRPLADGMFWCSEKALFFFICSKITTIFPSAAMIRRDRLFREPVFFAEDVVAGEDVDLWFRIIKTGGIGFIDKALSGYRIHTQSVTHRPGRNIVEPVLAHVRNYERSKGWLDRNQLVAYRRRIANDFFDLGYSFSRFGDRKKSIEFYCSSLQWRFSLKTIFGAFKATGRTI